MKIVNRYKFLFFVACMSISGYSFAEKGDREKPINIESNNVTVDDSKQTSVFEGNVVLTQGTIVIHADRMIVKQDKKGFKQGTAYGNPVSFKQKRDGIDEYVEGYGQRIEYDGTSEKVEFFSRARVKRGPDEVRGNYIAYNSKTEFFQVIGKGASDISSGSSRAHAVIQPKSKESPQNGSPVLAPAPNPVPVPAPVPAPVPVKPSGMTNSAQ
jgi:lipopolysaccharide export system protein LptA